MKTFELNEKQIKEIIEGAIKEDPLEFDVESSWGLIGDLSIDIQYEPENEQLKAIVKVEDIQ